MSEEKSTKEAIEEVCDKWMDHKVSIQKLTHALLSFHPEFLTTEDIEHILRKANGMVPNWPLVYDMSKETEERLKREWDKKQNNS